MTRSLLLLTAIVAGAHADTVRRIPAAEARQGVAVGRDDLYAVGNSMIARYDKRTGERRTVWRGDKALFPHLNSCAIIGDDLVCAGSNFPELPQRSMVQFFDPVTLAHRRTVSLGEGWGSLTWIDRHRGAWWAMFANYDGRGGKPGRDHRYTTLVQFDDRWRRTQSWQLPASILDRIAPMSVSGGGWGPDGRLYLTGHDRRELYALVLPVAGDVLLHEETIAMEAAGQAIDWDETDPGILYGIDRAGAQIIAMRIGRSVQRHRANATSP